MCNIVIIIYYNRLKNKKMSNRPMERRSARTSNSRSPLSTLYNTSISEPLEDEYIDMFSSSREQIVSDRPLESVRSSPTRRRVQPVYQDEPSTPLNNRNISTPRAPLKRQVSRSRIDELPLEYVEVSEYSDNLEELYKLKERLYNTIDTIDNAIREIEFDGELTPSAREGREIAVSGIMDLITSDPIKKLAEQYLPIDYSSWGL